MHKPHPGGSARGEVGPAARRQPVAHLEGLGQAEGLEPPDPKLVVRAILAGLRGQLGRDHARTASDLLQHRSGPRSVGGAVHPLQPDGEVGQVSGRQLLGGPQGDAGIGPGQPDVDPVELSLAAATEPAVQRRQGLEAGRVRVGLGQGRVLDRGDRRDLDHAGRAW